MRIEDRFWAKVDKRGPDECWPWTGSLITEPSPTVQTPDVLRIALGARA